MTQVCSHPKPPLHFKDWCTDPNWFDELHEKYRFTLDVAASDDNALLPRYCTRDGKWEVVGDDVDSAHVELIAPTHGLDPEAWRDERVFCNPPYESNGPESIGKWLSIGAMQVAEMSFFLLPPSTDVDWFHTYLWHTVDFKSLGPTQMARPGVKVEFPPGRMRFYYICAECGEMVLGDSPRAGNLFAVFQRRK